MIAFAEALRLVGEHARPLGSETVRLEEAAGRVLAGPVLAKIDSPRVDCSAMDGYAVREADLPGPLTLIGHSFPGRPYDKALTPGSCVRLFTGAAVPQGADRVVIQEEAERVGDRVSFPARSEEPPHIRAKGSDFRAGDVLLEAGQLLSPRALVTAASADAAEVSVWRRPRVLILATGDELIAPGEARAVPSQVPESISAGLSALATEWGAQVLGIWRLRDDLPTLAGAAAEAVTQADLVIVTGGASVGERDHAKAMFEPLGLELVFSKVAIKPGKPVWFGRCGQALVMGLPGNPTSAMVTARLLLVPLLAGIAGRDGSLKWTPVPLAEALPPVGNRVTFFRARRTPTGALPLGNQQSGAQAPLAHADLLLSRPANSPACNPGEVVQAIDF